MVVLGSRAGELEDDLTHDVLDAAVFFDLAIRAVRAYGVVRILLLAGR